MRTCRKISEWISRLSITLILIFLLFEPSFGDLDFLELSNSDDGLCSAIITRQGYLCSEYSVRTEDGYLLSVQRIPHPREAVTHTTGRPVFLQHGLFQGGDDWVLNSPSESLAFLLADVGYDVWIGNNRGTKWSSRHVSLSPSEPAFWDFSWEEIATYDLPAMVGLVHHSTGQRVHYVGHSQGTLVLLAALSERRLLDVIKSAVLLSPIAYLEHTTSNLLNALTKLNIDKLYSSSTGEQEFDIGNPINSNLILLICSTSGVDCSDIPTAFTGPNCCINVSRNSYYMEFEPQPTSIKNLLHLSQMIRSGNLSKYDYGEAENYKRYRQAYPPLYNLSNLPDSIVLMVAYGGKDCLSDAADVEHLTRDLCFRPRILQLPEYGHTDFILGTNAHMHVYIPVIDFFNLIN